MDYNLEVITPSIDEVQFLGEGNDHIVLGLKKQKRALRIRKVFKTKEESFDELYKRAKSDIDFERNVAVPLFGRRMVDTSSKIIILNPNIHKNIMEFSNKYRREDRKLKDINSYGISIQCENALCFNFMDEDDTGVVNESNLSQSSKAFAIELKFKQSYLETTLMGSKLCKYCIGEFIKDEKKDSLGLEHCYYCPFDLFSGELHRMKLAVDRLFQVPGKNIRVFKDEKKLDCLEEYSYLKDVILEVITCSLEEGGERTLEDETLSCRACTPETQTQDGVSLGDGFVFAQENAAENIHNPSKDITQIKMSKYGPNSLLGKMLTVHHLDHLGIVNAHKLYEKLCVQNGSVEGVNEILADATYWKNKTNYLNKIRKDKSEKIFNKNLGFTYLPDREELKFDIDLEIKNLTSDEIRLKLQEYLVSMSLKDVSVIIVVDGPFQKKDQEFYSPFWIHLENQGYFKCQIRLVDLVAKPPNKIGRHLERLEKLETKLKELYKKGLHPSCCHYLIKD